MTSVGDLCACGDLAAPGQELCSPCLQDARHARAERVAEIALQTAEHEAKVCDEDAAA